MINDPLKIGKLAKCSYYRQLSLDKSMLFTMISTQCHLWIIKGRTDLFIRITCNPNWKEITENVGNNGTFPDKPDIAARVINQKVQE